jgi:hypothetical protein
LNTYEEGLKMKIEFNKETLKSQRGIRPWGQTQLAYVSGLRLRTSQRIKITKIAAKESAKSIAVVYKCSRKELVTDLSPKLVENLLLAMRFNSSTEVILL